MCVLKEGEALIFILVRKRTNPLRIPEILKIVFHKTSQGRF